MPRYRSLERMLDRQQTLITRSRAFDDVVLLSIILLRRLLRWRHTNCPTKSSESWKWRHNERDAVSNHQPNDCLLNRVLKAQIREPSKFRASGLWEGNSPVTGEFPTQRASNAENVSIWWRHHVWWLFESQHLYSVPSVNANGFALQFQ